jgi:hypothetical protein
MSIASTMIAMGYLPVASDERTCGTCANAQRVAGLRCTDGGFYVNTGAGCRRHVPQAAAVGASQPTKVQIGPTDV